jgi:hypothetical protein
VLHFRHVYCTVFAIAQPFHQSTLFLPLLTDKVQKPASPFPPIHKDKIRKTFPTSQSSRRSQPKEREGPGGIPTVSKKPSLFSYPFSLLHSCRNGSQNMQRTRLGEQKENTRSDTSRTGIWGAHAWQSIRTVVRSQEHTSFFFLSTIFFKNPNRAWERTRYVPYANFICKVAGETWEETWG